VGFGALVSERHFELSYLCRYFNLPEVANYWEQVIILNDSPKHRFKKK
jgi:UDPglucose 6-dehydrogenase